MNLDDFTKIINLTPELIKTCDADRDIVLSSTFKKQLVLESYHDRIDLMSSGDNFTTIIKLYLDREVPRTYILNSSEFHLTKSYCFGDYKKDNTEKQFNLNYSTDNYTFNEETRFSMQLISNNNTLFIFDLFNNLINNYNINYNFSLTIYSSDDIISEKCIDTSFILGKCHELIYGTEYE